MFKFVQIGREYFVKFHNDEIRILTNHEIELFYERINYVITLLGLKEDYLRAKSLNGKSLLDFAVENDIDLDACLFPILSKYNLEKPLV